MLGVLLDRFDQLQPLVYFLFVLRQVIKVNNNLVNLTIGQLLKHILILVLGLSSPVPFLAALLLGFVILVHKIILVTKVILINANISESRGDGLLGRRLEVGEEVPKGSFTMLAPAHEVWLQICTKLTLLRRIVDRLPV